MKKEAKRAIKLAEEAGWRKRQGSKHVLLYPPNGSRPITVASDHTKRGWLNFCAKMKANGLDLSQHT